VAGDRIGAAVALRDQHGRIGAVLDERIANRFRAFLRQRDIQCRIAGVVWIAGDFEHVACASCFRSVAALRKNGSIEAGTSALSEGKFTIDLLSVAIRSFGAKPGWRDVSSVVALSLALEGSAAWSLSTPKDRLSPSALLSATMIRSRSASPIAPPTGYRTKHNLKLKVYLIAGGVLDALPT
jgi:hypothetical protein